MRYIICIIRGIAIAIRQTDLYYKAIREIDKMISG